MILQLQFIVWYCRILFLNIWCHETVLLRCNKLWCYYYIIIKFYKHTIYLWNLSMQTLNGYLHIRCIYGNTHIKSHITLILPVIFYVIPMWYPYFAYIFVSIYRLQVTSFYWTTPGICCRRWNGPPVSTSRTDFPLGKSSSMWEYQGISGSVSKHCTPGEHQNSW